MIRTTGFVLLLGVGGLAGCGEPTYNVHGVVRQADGTPLGGGQIELQHAERQLSAVGYIRPDGSFLIGTNELGDGAYAGEYRVAIKPPPLPVIDPSKPEQAQTAIAHRRAWLESVPVKYLSPDTSELTVEVTDGSPESLEIVLE